MAFERRDFLKLTGAAGALGLSSRAPALGGKFPGKVIILGFDGANPAFVEEWMNDGLLPNLAKLRAKGTYARIGTANPPQTPVSWASFATGLNPGKTGLFDFLTRDPQGDPVTGKPMPEFALIEEKSSRFLAGEKNALALASAGLVAGGLAGLAVKAVYNVIKRRMNPELVTQLFSPATLAAAGVAGALVGAAGYKGGGLLPSRMPSGVNRARGQTFWQFLDERSIATLSCRVPARFPADELKHGRALAGLGVPDVRKSTGLFTYYTTELLPVDTNSSEMGGTIVPLYFRPTTGETETVIFGPDNSVSPGGPKLIEDADDEITVPLKLKDLGGKQLQIEVGGWKGTLSPGQWSKPVTFTFEFNSLIKFQGYAKFHLLEMNPDVKLFLQPISFHPKSLAVRYGPVRISTPQSFAGDLFDKYGPYKTLGWAADTNALREEFIPEEVFLEDLWEYVGQYREMMNDFLTGDEPLFIDVYSFTDRIGHMFWHHLDTSHPMYDAGEAAKYGKVILQAYQKMDDIVGDAMKTLDDKKWLFVLSDHGFQSFSYGLNINTWLAQNGYLGSVKGTVSRQMTLKDLFSGERFWQDVDFSKTKAYAMGLGGLYINLKGREKHGTVEPGEEYERVVSEIIDGFEKLVDPATGKKPVYKVYRREEIYKGFDPDYVPDLRVANAPGYRASWQSALGATPPDVIEVVDDKWGGDHCSYEPSITKGIFFCSKQLSRTDPDLLDFFPTVLEIFGFKAPGDIDGKSLL